MPRLAAAAVRLPTCLIHSFRRHIALNHLDLAVDSLPLLAGRGFRPSSADLAALLNACLRTHNLLLARRVYHFLSAAGYRKSIPHKTRLANHLLRMFFDIRNSEHALNLFNKMPSPNVFSYNAMLSGYLKLGNIDAARTLFDKMPHRDVVSWNTLIFALARSDSCREAINLYLQMRRSSREFNGHTFSALLSACLRLGDIPLLKQVHGQLLPVGLLSNLIISSSLLDGYAKCGCLDDARKIFDETPVRDVLMWTALVHGYAKHGNLSSARSVFEQMAEKNSVSWTALIAGYARHGLCFEALDLFRAMMYQGFMPDQFTFSSALCASSSSAFIKQGEQIHAHLLRTRYNPNAIVLSSLIDMYSKCGCLESGKRVFYLTPTSKRDVVMWNTMMSAVGQHGDGRAAILLFEEMTRLGTKPDSNSFVVLLAACSHSGLVEEGIQFFGNMSRNYGVVPDEDHYLCFVDLLGRAGMLEEAVSWLKKSPLVFNAEAWNALLAACKMHGNLEMGKQVAEYLMKLDPQNSAAFVVLSNIYAEDSRWGYTEKLRQKMEVENIRKEQAVSWIEIDNTAHSLEAADQSNTGKEDLDVTLGGLICQVKDDFSIR